MVSRRHALARRSPRLCRLGKVAQLPAGAAAATRARRPARAARQIFSEREAAIAAIEARCRESRRSGAQQAWLDGVDAAARTAVSEVDGPTIGAIAAEIGWADDVERLFREGAPFVGALPASGVAERRVVREEREPVSVLMGRAEAQNGAIIASLRDDAHAAELHAGAVADAALGRMTKPVPVDDLALHDKILAPRFSVVQGNKPDGSPKACAPRGLASAAPARRIAGARRRRLFSRESQRRYQCGGKMAPRHGRPAVRVGKCLPRGGAPRAIQPAAARQSGARARRFRLSSNFGRRTWTPPLDGCQSCLDTEWSHG